MFVTNWNSTTKIQKISEITNFFRHYFLSRTEVKLQKERIDVDGLIAKLDIYAVISKSKQCSRVGKELQINPFEEDTFLLGVPTFLCTENQRDGKFYQIVCNYYLSHIEFDI